MPEVSGRRMSIVSPCQGCTGNRRSDLRRATEKQRKRQLQGTILCPHDIGLHGALSGNIAVGVVGLRRGGDGDLLRLAGNGRTAFWTATCYPCVVDFDGDGRRDLVGSNRCIGGVVTWFRNIGEDDAPLFSEREAYPLKTVDGQPITNPNRGFLLTVAVCDWDGDGRARPAGGRLVPLSDVLQEHRHKPTAGVCAGQGDFRREGLPGARLWRRSEHAFPGCIYRALRLGRRWKPGLDLRHLHARADLLPAQHGPEGCRRAAGAGQAGGAGGGRKTHRLPGPRKAVGRRLGG